MSSLGSEKALENNRIIIRPLNETEPHPEKTNFSQKNTNSNFKSIKINTATKTKKNGSLTSFDPESALVNSSRSKRLTSVSVGDRMISESVDRSKNMIIHSSRDEYQIDNKKIGKPSKEQGVGNNKNRKVYRESNRASCIMIKKLKGDYYA